jgi:recombination protein RecR
MYEGAVQDLIDELGRLPGVGPKSAQRIAFHLLAADPVDVRRLVAALTEVKDKVRFCSICGNVSEEDQCRICRDPRRDQTVICVVEEPKDVVAIEKTREFRGRYHVLGGAISPIEGVGPDDLRIRELMARLADGDVTELILATDPNLEGEATATYLARLVKPLEL